MVIITIFLLHYPNSKNSRIIKMKIPMGKLDLLKQKKDLYSASLNKVTFLTISPLNYLMINGEGDPNTSQLYKDSLQALYSLAYALKFAIKKDKPSINFKVMPLEGLWWIDDMNLFSVKNKGDWKWVMMILQPDLINHILVKEICEQVVQKKGLLLAKKVRLEQYIEGDCAQLLHLGSYSAESENIEKLHKTIFKHGYQRKGKHHEIYLNTPLKTTPEKLKTIIRQPIVK